MLCPRILFFLRGDQEHGAVWRSSGTAEQGCNCWSRLPESQWSYLAHPCLCLFAHPVDLHYGPSHLFFCFLCSKRPAVLLGPRQVPRAVLLATWSRSTLRRGHLAPQHHHLHRAHGCWGPELLGSPNTPPYRTPAGMPVCRDHPTRTLVSKGYLKPR